MQSKPQVAVASSTQVSADAAADVIAAGGNAVDAAIAASLVAVTTEPGICSLGGGGFITLWPPGDEPITIDGNIEMPGRATPVEQLGRGAWEVSMEYGNGLTTLVGHGSVGTPGALAAYARASERYGKLPWSELLQPAIAVARQGFAMSQASYQYLQYSHECVYGWLPDSHAPLHHENGQLKEVGQQIVVEHLADSLDIIAREGAKSFYQGDLAKLIAQDFDAQEGAMTGADLAAYEVLERKPILIDLNGWQLATNPAPAVGGATLFAMLELLKAQALDTDPAWSAETVGTIAKIQQRVLMYRLNNLDYSDQVEQDIAVLLDQARAGAIPLAGASASTVHTSATDHEGLCCAITMSSGYGAGVMPPGTGIWMNNCLGEIELNRKGLNAGPPGMRLASNMAPTVGRHQHGHALAIGSPGADRITSALLCTLKNFALDNQSLEHAIASSRLHVDINDGDPRVAIEPDLDSSRITLPVRKYQQTSMFFGGVGATMLTSDGALVAAADPRRTGGKLVT